MHGDLLDACPTACFALDKNGVVQKKNKHAAALSPFLEASQGQDFFRNFQEGRPATELDGTFLLHTPTQECFSVSLGGRNGQVLAVVTHITQLDNLQNTLDNVLQVAVADMSARKKLASQVDALLHIILPDHVCKVLANTDLSELGKSDKVVFVEQLPWVAVIFTDVVGFTALAENNTAIDVIRFLNSMFARFDAIMDRFGVTKIKTIGDAYLAISLPNVSGADMHKNSFVLGAVLGAFEMIGCLRDMPLRCEGIRIGIHVGPAVGGVVGTSRFFYDVFGDTVNLASRLESTSEPNKVHVSIAVKECLEEIAGGAIGFQDRGSTEIKGKGKINTFFAFKKH
jgi:class 3 adenylate cyclase